MSAIQHNTYGRPSRYIYEKPLPGREEMLRVENMSCGVLISVDCRSAIRGEGATREEAVRALVVLLIRDKSLDPAQVLLDLEHCGEGHSSEIADLRGNTRKALVGTWGDVRGDGDTRWFASVDADQILSPCLPVDDATRDVLRFAAKARTGNPYLTALCRGLIDMRRELHEKFGIG